MNFWINFSKNFDYTSAFSEAMKAIKRSFDQNGITIPFPIRTLYLADGTIESLKQP